MKTSKKFILAGAFALSQIFISNTYGLDPDTLLNNHKDYTIITMPKSTLFQNPVPIGYVEALSRVEDSKGNKVFSEPTITSLYELGLTIDEIISPIFVDTDKPNAVVIFPTSDDSIAFAATKNLLERIRGRYDTFVKVASTEQEVYSAIMTIPNVELLVLSGHGSQMTLGLGSGKHEKYKIDISDSELGKYLQNLNPNAPIVLNSCLNAQGGYLEINLANFIMQISHGRKVIAAMDLFSPFHIRINSDYPLDLSFMAEPPITSTSIHKVDVTYTN